MAFNPEHGLFEDLELNEALYMPNDSPPRTMALERQIAIAHPHHPVDTGAVGEFLGRVQQGFFELVVLTNSRDNRERHRYNSLICCNGSAVTLWGVLQDTSSLCSLLRHR